MSNVPPELIRFNNSSSHMLNIFQPAITIQHNQTVSSQMKNDSTAYISSDPMSRLVFSEMEQAIADIRSDKKL